MYMRSQKIAYNFVFLSIQLVKGATLIDVMS